EEIRRERTAMVVRKASENKASAFAPSLLDKDRIAEEVAREWQQVRLRERMEWLYNYDATAGGIFVRRNPGGGRVAHAGGGFCLVAQPPPESRNPFGSGVNRW